MNERLSQLLANLENAYGAPPGGTHTHRVNAVFGAVAPLMAEWRLVSQDEDARPFSTAAAAPDLEAFKAALRAADVYVRQTLPKQPKVFTDLIAASKPMLLVEAVGAVQEETEHPQRLEHEGKCWEYVASWGDRDMRNDPISVAGDIWRFKDGAFSPEQFPSCNDSYAMGRESAFLQSGAALYRPVVEPQPPQPIEFGGSFDSDGWISTRAGKRRDLAGKSGKLIFIPDEAAEGVGAQEVAGS